MNKAQLKSIPARASKARADESAQVPLEVVMHRIAHAAIEQREKELASRAANSMAQSAQSYANGAGILGGGEPTAHEVHEQMGFIQGRMEELNNVIESLVDRLSPVSRGQSPSPANALEPKVTMTSHGTELSGVRGRLGGFIERLHDAKSRLEI